MKKKIEIEGKIARIYYNECEACTPFGIVPDNSDQPKSVCELIIDKLSDKGVELDLNEDRFYEGKRDDEGKWCEELNENIAKIIGKKIKVTVEIDESQI